MAEAGDGAEADLQQQEQTFDQAGQAQDSAADPNKKRRLDEIAGAGDEEEGGEERKKAVRQWLNPLTPDQVQNVILDLVAKDTYIYERLYEVLRVNPVHRKIFIRGLSWDTTDESLKAAFSKFGEVVEATVAMDKVTNKSKAYGFVIMADMEGANAALQSPEKEIDGRRTQSNLAAVRTGGTPGGPRGGGGGYGGGGGGYGGGPGGGGGGYGGGPGGGGGAGPATGLGSGGGTGMGTGPSPGSEDPALRKLFVHSLSWDTSTELLHQSFIEFGEIEEAIVIVDAMSSRSKGFGFVTFKQAASAARALQAQPMWIDGRQVKCHMASEKDSRPRGGGGGGRGGGDGNWGNQGGGGWGNQGSSGWGNQGYGGGGGYGGGRGGGGAMWGNWQGGGGGGGYGQGGYNQGGYGYGGH